MAEDLALVAAAAGAVPVAVIIALALDPPEAAEVIAPAAAGAVLAGAPPETAETGAEATRVGTASAKASN